MREKQEVVETHIWKPPQRFGVQQRNQRHRGSGSQLGGPESAEEWSSGLLTLWHLATRGRERRSRVQVGDHEGEGREEQAR